MGRRGNRITDVRRGDVIEVALAHDYLTQRGGAEKVVLAMHRGFPSAPLFTTLYAEDNTYPEFADVDIRTSWINRLAILRAYHRLAFPILAPVSQRMRINAEHAIVSSSGWAHGFVVSGAKIVYCHSPARWLYQPDAYLGRGHPVRKNVLRVLRGPLKRWDRRHAATATKYFANSSAVRDRIFDAYGINAEVLPAPHSIDVSLPQEPVDLTLIGGASGFYLCVSRLLPYKNVDVVVQAFNSTGLPLVVVGAGPEERDLRRLAGSNIRLLKSLTDAQMRWLYARCTALVAASYEDYGLTPIEAAAFGKPAIALRWGGFLDTIVEGRTGVYFDSPQVDDVVAAVVHSQSIEWDPAAITAHGDSFSEGRFIARLREVLAERDSAPD